MKERCYLNKNGQWCMEKWNMEKRCWEGYEPTPGKKAYEKGSCQPVSKEEAAAPKPAIAKPKEITWAGKGHAVHCKCKDCVEGGTEKPILKMDDESVKKDDAPHAPESPEDSAHDVVEEGSSLKDELESLSSEERAEMLRHLRTLKDKRKHRSEENRKIGEDANKAEVAPEGSKNRETYLEAFGKSEIEVSFYDNGDAEVEFGSEVPSHYEQEICETLLKKGYEEMDKKEWSPKAEHKSDKGGLTEAGRKSYNRATGGNLKAPQPGGGPRKRSFCARNKGQIKMHGIDCRKDPEKRACKARRRWKCTN